MWNHGLGQYELFNFVNFAFPNVRETKSLYGLCSRLKDEPILVEKLEEQAWRCFLWREKG